MSHPFVVQIKQEPDQSTLQATVRLTNPEGNAVHIHVVATQDTGELGVGSRSVVIQPDADYEVTVEPVGADFRRNATISTVTLAIESWTTMLNTSGPLSSSDPTVWKANGNYPPIDMVV